MTSLSVLNLFSIILFKSIYQYVISQNWTLFKIIIFFNCYLAAPRPTLGRCQGDSLTNPMLIIAFYLFRPEGHREPRNEVGSLSPAEHLVGFEPGTLILITTSQRLNSLGHSCNITFGTSYSHCLNWAKNINCQYVNLGILCVRFSLIYSTICQSIYLSIYLSYIYIYVRI